MLYDPKPLSAFICCYFPEGTAPPRRVEQKPVRGVLKEHLQPAMAQGWLRLHVPPQVVVAASLRNWPTETAPAHTVEMTMLANSMICAIFLNTVVPFLLPKLG
jgi:hypothetical protein